MHSRNLHVTGLAVASLVGTLIFLLALDGGAFSLPTRSVLGIAIWWSILLAVLLGLVPTGPYPRAAVAIVALLGGFALWTGLSATWAPSAEKAFLELARVLLYLGVFVLAAALGLAGAARRVSVGLALGIVGVTAIALLSRFFPDLISSGQLSQTIATARLSFPVDYWNGLAMLVALSLPLLLALATTARGIVQRALTVAPLPAIASVSYLASSRGGFIVILAGLLLFVTLSGRRWSAVIAAAVGATGSVAALALLVDRPALVDTPLAPAARAEAGTAALLMAAVCLLTGLAYGLVRAVPLRWRPPARLGWSAVAVAVAVVAVTAVLSSPLQKFEEFRRAPVDSPPTVEGHLLNVSSTGRWQQWEAAIDQFRSAPLRGDGAGSYGAWWLQHGQIRSFVTEAHSLYLEVLGELGIVGFSLLIGALGLGLATGVLRSFRVMGELRETTAGVTAAAGAYMIGASIDWVWELTVVSVVGLACLGLACCSARGSMNGQPHRAAHWVIAAAAVAAIALQAIPYLTQALLRDSERAVARGDIGVAITAADGASRIQPWAASPHLQLALVSESAGNLPAAERHLDEALRSDSRDWRLWLVATRLHVKQGEIAEARSALAEARRLNPNSSVLARLDEDD